MPRQSTSPASTGDLRSQYRTRVAEIHSLGSVLNLLSWDQEVSLPRGGVPARARQRSALATVVHQRLTDPELGRLLDELAGGKHEPFLAADLREMRRQRDRAVKIPSALVAAKSEAESHCHQAWADARRDDTWSVFEPHLARLLDLKRQEAEAVGYETEAYDALLDEYEPGATAAQLATVFSELRRDLTALLAELGPAAPGDGALLSQGFAEDRQQELSRRVLRAVGYDFERGRLDTSLHPFTEGIAPGDVRITTRFHPQELGAGLYASLHEGGHALYEQGLPPEHEGTAVAQAVSVGIHESQSRLWENQVGRSRPFFTYLRPILVELFPDQLGAASEETLYRAANVVRPGAIRIEADEVTYNLHIILRMEMERALLRGDLPVAEVPGVWRERMRDSLGVVVPDDRNGALQDIHWAVGVFGYFPTYTLGNLYSAQFFAAARQALPELDAQIARGDFQPLLAWLRREIHARGSLLLADDLCRQVTGSGVSPAPFLDYLRSKYRALRGDSGGREIRS
ncbi:MAG: carboxypeptidase M32 [Candidatus Krumholzibacteriia bacterium]